MELNKRELTIIRSGLNHLIAEHVVALKDERHPDMKVIRHDTIVECTELKSRIMQEYLEKSRDVNPHE